MGSYTVTELIDSRPWSKDGGDPTVIYWNFRVDGVDQMVNMGRKPGNPVTVGETIQGELEPDDRNPNRLKFKKAMYASGGGGGPRQRDPKESRAIQRMASHKSAVALIHAKAAAGLATEEDFKPGKIAALADWLDQDIARVKEQA